MRYLDFLRRVIDEGIAAARTDYAKPEDADRLRGSVDGFNACAEKDPRELPALQAEFERDALMRHTDKDYWYWRCRALEVEWVCNVVSAALVNEGYPPLLVGMPTARGVQRAAAILGVSGVLS